MKTSIGGKGEINYDMPKVMGILNLTPDSFSDGGMYSGEAAAKHVFEMIDDGADIIDIGGESTRPGATPVSEEDELNRVIPFLKEYASSISVPISIDTYKANVAQAALDAGADIINDVSGLRGEKMMQVVASNGVPAIIMHMHGWPMTMQNNPTDDINVVIDFLSERIRAAEDHGIKQIITDPGVGFGKTYELNEVIIDNSSKFSFGYPVLIGASRKAFLERCYLGMYPDDATVEASKRAIKSGANIIRVHNVKKVVDGLRQQI